MEFWKNCSQKPGSDFSNISNVVCVVQDRMGLAIKSCYEIIITGDFNVLCFLATHSFEKHKGYGTALHRAALYKHGALVIHRKLFLQKILSS